MPIRWVYNVIVKLTQSSHVPRLRSVSIIINAE